MNLKMLPKNDMITAGKQKMTWTWKHCRVVRKHRKRDIMRLRDSKDNKHGEIYHSMDDLTLKINDLENYRPKDEMT